MGLENSRSLVLSQGTMNPDLFQILAQSIQVKGWFDLKFLNKSRKSKGH